jgi:lipoprotein-anchoring transpeptidase ErfK/SrfK
VRLLVGLALIAGTLAASGAVAAAQSYPPPPLMPGDYYQSPYAPPPPGYAPPPYNDRDAGGASARPYNPGYDAQAYYDDPVAPPPYFSNRQYPRPPADVGAPTVSALPPDYRPEQGPTRDLPQNLRRQLVDYMTTEPAGTIIIDTPNTYLYLILGNGKALRYGIGVGREGFTWSGTERISRMTEWPDWHPPKEMIDRQPYLPRFMAGGEGNPLGARALYLGSTLYRIHGTNQPSTIGHFVSSGCIRLTNEDIEDLYNHVGVGSRIVVLPGSAASATISAPGRRSRPN